MEEIGAETYVKSLELCRICIKSDEDMKPLFEMIIVNSNGVKIVDFIRKITMLEISKTDGFPKSICTACITALSNTYFLIEMCLYTNQQLQHLKQLKDSFKDGKENGIETGYSEKCNKNNSLEKIIEAIKLVDNKDFDKEEAIDNLDQQDVILPQHCKYNVRNNFEKGTSIQHDENYDDDHLSKTDSNGNFDFDFKKQTSPQHDKKYDNLSKTDSKKNLDIEKCIKTDLEDCGLILLDKNKQNLVVKKKSTKRNVYKLKYECNLCDKKFNKKSEFRSHGLLHNTSKHYKCNNCTKSFSKMASLTNHIKIHFNSSEKKFHCNICGEAFCHSHALNQHQYKHMDEKPFPCTICDKGCLTKASLRSHMQVHTKKNVSLPHICHVCNKEYPYASFLTEHMKNHTGEKPYLCNLCGKGFRQSGALAYHLRSHSGTKLFKCELCDNTFMSSGTLKVHMRIHTNERPYVCDVCGRAFRQSTDMKSHRRTHFGEKRFLCTICGKRFTSAGQLTIHIRSHTGEKPYVCNHCGKNFSTRSMLVKHVRIHTGEKPFTCTTCNKSFNQRSTLNTHIATHKKQSIGLKQSTITDMNAASCILVDQEMGTQYNVQTIETENLGRTEVNLVVLPAAVPFTITVPATVPFN